MKIIQRRLNLTYHKGINAFPSNVIKGVEFPIHFKQENNDASSIHTKKNLEIRERIFVRNFSGSKLDNQYLGPVIVSRVRSKGKWVKIRGFDDWIHVKNI